MSIMMDLNTSMSPNECISIDFDEDDPNINLNYLEDYFDSLLNQLESELSYLPESSNFITNNKKNHDNNNDTSTINTNNVDNKSISYNRDVNIVSSCISSSIQNNLINNHESLNHHRNHHHNHHLNQLHTIDSTINSHNGADHANHQSTTNDTSNQQFKSDKIIITNQSSSTSSTSTTATVNNYSSAPSLSKFNQRESPLSFSNYSRSSFYENNDEISYNLLTASQIQKIIDYYKPLVNSNNNGETTEVKWDRKTKKPNGTSNTNNLTYTNLFGCDVNNIEKAFGGLTLPPFIENALVYLARYGINAVGIFRKSGVKSRITALRQKLEAMTGSNKREPGTGTMTKKTMTDLPNGSPMNGGASVTLNRPDLEIGSGSSTINYRLSSSYAAGDDFCVYDVADMVKMWLREIKPRPLITKEVINAYKELMTNNNININNNNNSSDGPSPIELCHKLTVLLTDSQRAILEIFLNFLSLFAANCEINQMNSQNLAICFTPSLCECDSLTGGSGGFAAGAGLGGINQINTNLNNNILNNLNNNINNGLPFVSPSENGFNVNGSPLPRSADTEIIFDAQRCLQYLIDNCSYISMVSLSSLPFSPSPTLATFNNINNHESISSSSSPMRSGEQGDSDHPMDGSLSVNEDAISTVNHLNPLMSSLSLSNDINCTINNNNNNFNTNGFFLNTSSSPSLINGGNLLPSTYESSIIINAAPSDILKRILYQKNLFDPTVVEWRVIKHSPSENCDVFEYKVQSSFFLPLKTFTIDRRWSFIENQPATETSTSSSPRSFYSSLKKSKSAKTSFKGIVLRETGYLYDSWWRIGTQGEGKCQLDISIAIDLRGHSYYWYTNTFPAIIDWQLNQIKQSFLVDFIETKNFKSTTV